MSVRISSFRGVTLRISEGLSKSNVQALKFLCEDVLSTAILETTLTGHDLLDNLRSAKLIAPTNVCFLAECLEYISRPDLKKYLYGIDEADLERKLKTYVPNISRYRTTLFRISEEIDTSDVGKMKYLVEDMKKTQKEKITSSLDLLTYLQHSGKINYENMIFLKDMFVHMKRQDLVEKINSYEDSAEVPMVEDVSNLSRCQPEIQTPVSSGVQSLQQHVPEASYGRRSFEAVTEPVLLKIAMEIVQSLQQQTWTLFGLKRKVGVEELNHLSNKYPDMNRRVYQLLTNLLSGSSNNYKVSLSSIIHTSEEKEICNLVDLFTVTYYTHLQDMEEPALLDIATRIVKGLEDQTFILFGLKRKVGIEELKELASNFPDKTRRMYQLLTKLLSKSSNDHKDELSALVQSPEELNICRMVDLFSLTYNSHFGGSSNLASGFGNQTVSCNQTQPTRKGICVIFSNEASSDAPTEMSSRHINAAKMEASFTQLGFMVHRKNDLGGSEMVQEMMRLALDMNSSQCEYFVCCVLSRGHKDVVYGTDGKPVKIGYLIDQLKPLPCPTLENKPKVFFILAYQDEIGGGHEPEADDEAENLKEVIAGEKEFLIGYTRIYGCRFCKGREPGTCYISKLCDRLEKHGTKVDLRTLLTDVNDEICPNKEVMGCVRPVNPISTLKSKLLFG